MKTLLTHRARLGETDCRICPLRGSDLFASLEEQDFIHIHHAIERFGAAPHTVLYRTGERGRTVLTLRTGLIKLVRYLPDGSQRIVRLSGATDVVGLEAVVGWSYQHNAVTLTDCEVCAIPVALIERLAQEQPRLYQELMRRWQQALAQADDWLTQFSLGSARQRVARLLLQLMGDNQRAPFRLLAREDMSAMLGLTIETVSRIIAELRRQQVLHTVEAHLLTGDWQALHQIADGDYPEP